MRWWPVHEGLRHMADGVECRVRRKRPLLVDTVLQRPAQGEVRVPRVPALQHHEEVDIHGQPSLNLAPYRGGIPPEVLPQRSTAWTDRDAGTPANQAVASGLGSSISVTRVRAVGEALAEDVAQGAGNAPGRHGGSLPAAAPTSVPRASRGGLYSKDPNNRRGGDF